MAGSVKRPRSITRKVTRLFWNRKEQEEKICRGVQVHGVRLPLREGRAARPLPYLQGEKGKV